MRLVKLALCSAVRLVPTAISDPGRGCECLLVQLTKRVNTASRMRAERRNWAVDAPPSTSSSIGLPPLRLVSEGLLVPAAAGSSPLAVV
jgi:hypothetical protein